VPDHIRLHLLTNYNFGEAGIWFMRRCISPSGQNPKNSTWANLVRCAPVSGRQCGAPPLRWWPIGDIALSFDHLFGKGARAGGNYGGNYGDSALNSLHRNGPHPSGKSLRL